VSKRYAAGLEMGRSDGALSQTWVLKSQSWIISNRRATWWLEEHAKGCENEVGAEFAGEQRADRSGAESAQSGEFQHDHLKSPLVGGEDAALRLFPVDFVRTLNGFVRSSAITQ
jgi:hypothetical protein